MQEEPPNYLAEYKAVEDDCVQDQIRVGALDSEEPFPLRLQIPNHKELVEDLSHDVPPHDVADEVSFPSNRSSLHELIVWRFCGQCQCS